MSLERLKTVYFLGSLINNVKGIFNKTNELVDAVNALQTSTTPTYKSLSFVITQTGTSTPTFTVLEDSFTSNGDTITYSRLGIGRYKITSALGSFIANKLHVAPFTDFSGSHNVLIPFSDGAGLDGYYTLYYVDSSNLEINCYASNTSDYAELSTYLTSGTKLYFPEIKVYN